MSIETFVAAIVDFIRENEAWAVPIAFIVAFAESFCFVSIVWPGTAILAGITALLAASGADHSIVIPTIIAAGLGGTLGYSISYWIGLYFKNSIEHIWPFNKRPHLLDHGKNFFLHWGGWGVFGGHFIGPVRAVIPVVSGMLQMNQLTFQVANTISAFLWSAGIIAPSFFLVTFREDITTFMQTSPQSIAICLLVLAYLNSLSWMALPSLLIFFIVGQTYIFYDGNYILALCAGASGAFLGDCTAYYIGRKQSAMWKQISTNEDILEAKQNAISYLSENGNYRSIFGSKFYPSLRSYVPIAAGINKMSLGVFLMISFFSCVIWAGLLLSPIIILRLF